MVKSMGKRGEREKVAEANTHLAKNTMNTRKTHTIQGQLLPNGGHRSDRILARKDRSMCSLKLMWTSLLLIQPLYLQQHTYKDPSQDLVPNNLSIRYFRFLELFLTYMRI